MSGRLRVSALFLCFATLLSVATTPVLAQTTRTVCASGCMYDNPQAAIDDAEGGDVITLAAGETFVGSFELKVKPTDQYITIRSSAPDESLPAPGVRIEPWQGSDLPKLQSPTVEPALFTSPGAHHWRIETVEFLPNMGAPWYDIIQLGTSGELQDSWDEIPHSLVLDRVLVWGDPYVGHKRAIALNSASTEIINSYIGNIKMEWTDNQAICGWNGPGPFLIENNFIEASGENILFGGAPPTIEGLVPSDITLRRNVLTKNMGWRWTDFTVKNLLQLKNARRVLAEHNLLEHNWAHAQDGYAILFGPRNDEGTTPWTVVEDITFQHNWMSGIANGFNISGYDDQYLSQQSRRISISNNVITDLNGPEWGGDGIFILIGNAPADVTVDHNTVVHTGSIVIAYGAAISGFTYTNNLHCHNDYGIFGDTVGIGTAALDAYFPGAVFSHNVLAGGDWSMYPEENYFPGVDEFADQFVSFYENDYHLAGSSPYNDASTDGVDIGADIDTLGF
jgi:hypothetical protein